MSKQNELHLNVAQKINSVEDYKFEPIKGYPMLHWKGKRPFTATQFYPAQLKERHGEDVNGWVNKIFWGDNLQVMSHLLKKYRGQVDLVYIDPPFDSAADYKKKIRLKGRELINSSGFFEEKQYTDIWSNDEYLQFIYERILLIRELLAPNGVILLHCDFNKSHLLRCILDEIFGAVNFVNDIVWYYENKPQFGFMKHLPHDHDVIYAYVKSFGEHTLSHQQVPVKEVQQQAVVAWDPVLKKRVAKRDENGDIIYETRTEKYMGSVWTLPLVHPIAKERTGYPTQKPETLLERILKVYSNEGDLVFDCFMGSGTTQAVAMKTGRRFLGADINLGAIQTTTKRLLKISSELKGDGPKDPKVVQLKLVTHDHDGESEEEMPVAAEDQASYGKEKRPDVLYTGFEVYNVNHYDVFRNPLEAKDLLIKALEIQPLPNNNLYDGEKDGRMVKIMPVNRIATRADLNELTTNFDYKVFEKRAHDAPGKPVESILLVCMGHEPDLAASLVKNTPFKIDVEVVDILRDKSNLEFKRDSEAVVKIESGKLKIDQFYPMNLLQKLSLMKENVNDWRELVESVMIDFNYDGSVFEPKMVDIPEKNELVNGEYDIPKDAGTIRVKITDLLSESLEETIHGKA